MKNKLAIMAVIGLISFLAACGQPGPAGPQGPAGSNGQDGATGPQGAPGDSITPVQFCVGVPNTYPSSFPEYGFCISGVMYGNYWDGTNSWLAALPNGAYRSTATGLQCNFSLVGCTVSN